MKALIVSDVHANLEALEAVLADARARGGFDQVWCLGDVVGYGPDPGACLDLLRQQEMTCIAGNHDYAACGRIGVEEFNTHAAQAILWTASQLDKVQKEFLAGLREMESREGFTLVHGTLKEPVWEYLVNQYAALDTFSRLESRYCLVGHSHLPFVCTESEGLALFGPFVEGAPVKLESRRLIFNPGSVGQPRDGDPRASYALYDEDTAGITRHRAAYDVGKVQEKMRRVGLPEYLAERLRHGR
jgi:predicted phosphodiesterase